MTCQNPSCGAEVPPTAKFCPRCGTAAAPDTRVRGTPPPQPPQSAGGGTVAVPATGKNPVVATVLSVLLIGLGQLYNEDLKKGLVMFLAGALLFVPTAGLSYVVVLGWSAVDAYKVAEGSGRRWS